MPGLTAYPDDFSIGRRLWAWCILGFLFLALIVGGTPRYGSYGDVPLELLSLPMIFVSALRLAGQPVGAARAAAFFTCAAMLLLPLLQLIPLPPAIWTALPGRGFVLQTFEAAGLDTSWMPLSLSPPATLRSFLALLPPLAVFLATLTLTHHERRTATIIIVALGVASVVLGLAQIAAGPQSALRIYEVTNNTLAVGLFANRNHFAALLYCVMPLTAAWMIYLVQTQDMKKWASVLLTVVIYGSLILGLGISGSRAGILFAMLAILASLLLAWRKREREARGRASTVVFIAGLAGIFAVLQFGLAGILSRMGHDPLEDSRFILAQVTWRAASSVFPLGSGIGTFVPYYAMFETPADIGSSYANHAHNDWLEVWLEGGVPALLIAAAFLVWLAFRIGRSWKEGEGLDWLLARAASISVVLLLLHSFVDYPLRTTALVSFFAFCCALILDLPPVKQRSSKPGRRKPADDPDPHNVRRIQAADRTKKRRTSRTGHLTAQESRPYSDKTGRFQ